MRQIKITVSGESNSGKTTIVGTIAKILTDLGCTRITYKGCDNIPESIVELMSKVGFTDFADYEVEIVEQQTKRPQGKKLYAVETAVEKLVDALLKNAEENPLFDSIFYDELKTIKQKIKESKSIGYEITK